MTSAIILARSHADQDSAWASARLTLDRALRIAWTPFALLCAALVVVDSAVRFRGVSKLTAGMPSKWTSDTFTAALGKVGLNATAYAWSGLVLAVFSAAVWFGAAGVVVWRGWSHPMAKFTAYFLVLFGMTWLIEPARLPAGIRPEARFLSTR